MGVNRTISQVRSKALTFLYKEIKAGCKMRQLYKFLLCVVSESMLLVPVTSEKNAENIVYFLQQSSTCLLRGRKRTGKKQHLFRIAPPTESREWLQSGPDVLTTDSGNTIPKLLCNCKSRSFQTRPDCK